MHRFEFDATDQILRASVDGFWTIADCEAYARDLDRAAHNARRRAGHLKLLIDSTTQGVQSGEVAARLVEIRKAQLQLPRDRIAVCTRSMLARRQIARSIDSPQLGLFATPEEARAWLVSDDAARPAGQARSAA